MARIFIQKNLDLNKFWRLLQWNMLVYYMSIGSVLLLFGIFCGRLVYFVAIWNILWLLGIFYLVLVSCTKKNLATLRQTAFPKPGSNSTTFEFTTTMLAL
jgi:hypothetical protein